MSKTVPMFQLNLAPLLCFAALLCPLTLGQSVVERREALAKCAETTGWRVDQITDFHYRNERCTIDCITKQGQVMSHMSADGMNCHDESGDYKCALGSCLGPDDSRPKTSGLMDVEISIRDAHVPDLDIYPTQGESDAFVVVSVVDRADPAYEKNKILCYTHVVQDNAHPDWKGFTCKPMPLRKDAVLKFSVYDSDKPSPTPDTIGEVQEELGALVNSGITRLTLRHPEKRGDFYLNVNVAGRAH